MSRETPEAHSEAEIVTETTFSLSERTADPGPQTELLSLDFLQQTHLKSNLHAEGSTASRRLHPGGSRTRFRNTTESEGVLSL